MPSEVVRADEGAFIGDDEDVDELLAAHGGDARSALRECLQCIAALQIEAAKASRGFLRRPPAPSDLQAKERAAP